MKRSSINLSIQQATAFFEGGGWALPPKPKWDVTDFGLGDFEEYGLVLINLAEEVEYCEKLMYARKGQKTPAHYHKKKKEDIIVRRGAMAIQLWGKGPELSDKGSFEMKINGEFRQVNSGDIIELQAGERVTITQGIYHEFYPTSEECIIGEVSTANDDLNDNFFVNENIGRYSHIDEDEEPLITLVNEGY